MKMVRRDHSISPSDRSKIRSGRHSDGAPGLGSAERHAGGATGGRGRHRHFTRYWKTACRLSSGEVTSSIAPASPVAARLGQPRVERVGLRRSGRPPRPARTQAEHVVVRPGTRRASARGSLGADVDGVRMRVDQVADLVDVAFGEDPAVVDQQDVRRHRLDLVEDVARDDDALAGARPVLDQADGLAAASADPCRCSGSSRISSSGSCTSACASLTRWRMPLL